MRCIPETEILGAGRAAVLAEVSPRDKITKPIVWAPPSSRRSALLLVEKVKPAAGGNRLRLGGVILIADLPGPNGLRGELRIKYQDPR
jgi:hypothetical protein